MISCPSCGEPFPDPVLQCSACGFSARHVEGFVAWAPELAEAGGGFKLESFPLLAELEASNFWFRARNELIVWALRRYFGSPASLLEVGCGTGYVLSGVAEAFPQARLVGSEIFVAGLHHAASRLPNATLVQMDARRIPYVDEFDVAMALDVIEHIEEDKQVLGQLFQAVKPGGGILISVPQHEWLWSQADEYACHVRRYTEKDIREKVKAAGFVIERSTSFVALLLPLMLASRALNKRSMNYDPRREFEIPPAVNRTLEFVLRLERALIRAGADFPLGGSRFIVARKATSAETVVSQ